MRSRTVALVAVCCGVLAGPLLAGENLLANGEFDDCVTVPWLAQIGNPPCSQVDRASDPDSGSVRIAQNTGFLNATIQSECNSIQSGSPADAGGYFRALSTPPSGAHFKIHRLYYTDGSCSTLATPSSSGWLAVPASWALLVHQGTVPSGAKSVKVKIETEAVVKPNGDRVGLDLLGDGLYLGQPGATVPSTLFSDGFESGGFSDWVLVE